MTRRGLMGAIAAGAGGLLLAGRGLFGRSTRLRYRITVTCDTPAGLKSGTAVQEIRYFDPHGGFKPKSLGCHEIVGDAVTFEVNGRNFFFGLTQCSNHVGGALHIRDWQPRSAKARGNFAEEARALKAANATATLSAPVYEKYHGRGFALITFSDEKHFYSLEYASFDDLDPKLSVLRVEAKPTSEDVTRQALAKLPWLASVSVENVRQSDLGQEHPLFYFHNLSDRFGEVR